MKWLLSFTDDRVFTLLYEFFSFSKVKISERIKFTTLSISLIGIELVTDWVWYNISPNTFLIFFDKTLIEDIVFKFWMTDHTIGYSFIVFRYSIHNDLHIEINIFFENRGDETITLYFLIIFIEIRDDIITYQYLFEIIDSSIERLNSMIKSILNKNKFDSMFIKRNHNKRRYIKLFGDKLNRKITGWVDMRRDFICS